MLGYSVPSQPEPETFEGECLWLEPEDFLCRQPEIETLSIMIASRSTSTSNSKKKNCATVCHANTVQTYAEQHRRLQTTTLVLATENFHRGIRSVGTSSLEVQFGGRGY